MKSKKVKSISVKIITVIALLSVGCVTDFYNSNIVNASEMSAEEIKSAGITYGIESDEYSLIKPYGSAIEIYAVITGCDENVKSIDIPDIIDGHPVRKINGDAFSDHKELESISIPDTVRSVGKNAFQGTSLPSTSFVDGWLVEKDQNYYSYDVNESFSTLVIHEGVKGIASGLFENSRSIGEIQFPSTLKYIDNAAFENCEKLHSVFLPENVEFIGFWAFHTCVSLKYITIMNPDCLITYNGNLGAQPFYPNARIYGFKKSTAQQYTYRRQSLHIINSKSAPVLADIVYKTNFKIDRIFGKNSRSTEPEYNDYFPSIGNNTNVLDIVRAKQEILNLMEE